MLKATVGPAIEDRERTAIGMAAMKTARGGRR